MRRIETCHGVLLVLFCMPGATFAQSQTPWDGAYFGVNAGSSSTKSCSAWTQTAAAPSLSGAVSNRSCAGGSSFLGGMQVGENFQYKRFVWGLGLDLDASASDHATQSVKSPNAPPPQGSYVFSGKQSPNDFAIVGPRLGYAGTLLHPYLRAGAIIAGGSRDSVLRFTPPGTTKPSASFFGGRAFSTLGWAAGAGTEIGLNGPWSISLEYLHVNLGKGSETTAACSGLAASCTAFSGISFDSMHGSFTANIYRIGITYWFGYW
jgi:opacity protein-like surface antigen